MGQFKDAIDKQFPPKTDEQRAAYYAVRRDLDAQPVPRFFLRLAVLMMLAIPVVFWVSSAHASPAFIPAYAAAAKRAGEPIDRDYGQARWYDGPCAGRTYFECTPSKGSAGGTAKGLTK